MKRKQEVKQQNQLLKRAACQLFTWLRKTEKPVHQEALHTLVSITTVGHNDLQVQLLLVKIRTNTTEK